MGVCELWEVGNLGPSKGQHKGSMTLWVSIGVWGRKRRGRYRISVRRQWSVEERQTHKDRLQEVTPSSNERQSLRLAKKETRA